MDCVRCSAQTKSGKRCSRNTCRYYRYCYQHAKSILKLEIKKSNIPESGFGLFTLKPIKKGSVITPYLGKIVSPEIYDVSDSTYGIQLNKKEILDGQSTQSSLGRWSNSCRAGNVRKKQCKGQNAKLSGNSRTKTASVKANKNIKAGEEIFVSYGKSFWKK